ncbi:MAG: PD40 domain-containing protein, partial [Gammaproteobacteria bacterium]|nr:PD40 domain-containing protein [Gammaproteobacteria bacterium]
MGNLFEELKRRKVFRVATVYTVVAWLIIQIAGEVLPTFDTPQWVNQTIIIVLILGFPLAIALAWAFEIRIEGATPDRDSIKSSNPTLQTHPVNYVILFVLVTILFFLISLTVDLLGIEDSDPPFRPPTPDPVDELRFTINLGQTDLIDAIGSLESHIALSNDGSSLAYVVQIDGNRQLFLRSLNDISGYVVPNSTNAIFPVFSPDGNYISFSKFDGLYISPVEGGSGQRIVEGRRWYTPFWDTNDRIIGSRRAAPNSYGVLEVDVSDGQLDIFSSAEPIGAHLSPVPITGREFYLTTSVSWNPPGSVNVIAVSKNDGKESLVVSDGFSPHLTPTGHLLFTRSGSIWAVPFDSETLTVDGTPVPVESGVQMNSIDGISAYAVSDNGMLAYVMGDEIEIDDRQLVWVDLNGNVEIALSEKSSFFQARLSPDGNKVAVVDLTYVNTNRDIWVYDLL